MRGNFLRHTNDRVTRKYDIKPPSTEAIAAMRRLSETLLTLEGSKFPPTAPQTLAKWLYGDKSSMGTITG